MKTPDVKKSYKLFVGLATTLMFASSAMGAETPNIHEGTVAKQLLENHLSSPRVTSDPFINSANSYVNYRRNLRNSVTVPSVQNRVSNFVLDLDELIEDREYERVSALESVHSDVSRALENDDHDEVRNIMGRYYEDYKLQSESRADQFKSGIAGLMRDSIIEHTDTLTDVSENYRIATHKLLGAYNDSIVQKRDKIYGQDSVDRADKINSYNERVAPVVTLAHTFSTSCPACEMPEITPPPVVEVGVAPPPPELEVPETGDFPMYKCISDTTGIYKSLCDQEFYLEP